MSNNLAIVGNGIIGTLCAIEIKRKHPKLDIYLICQSESATQEAIILRENIKKTYPSLSIKVNLGLEGLGSQFKKADKSEASVAIILGEEELKQNMFSLKNLRTKSDQETLTYKELLEKLNEL